MGARRPLIPHQVFPTAAFIVFVTLLAYGNSFGGPFVLDDGASITQNPSIRQLWPPATPPVGAPTGGRPVANFTYAVNYALSGEAVWSYHATNLAIHISTALLLFGVVRRTLLSPPLRVFFDAGATMLAGAIALIWAVHPLQTATVDYVSQRTEQLMAFFYLLTLYSFIRSTTINSRFWALLAIAACALGMASKEVMVTAPVLVFLYDRTFVAGTFRNAWVQRGRLHLALGATWIVLAGLMLSSHLTARGVGFGLGISALDYGLTEIRVLCRYLSLTLWPHPLVFDYGWDFVRSFAEVWPFAIVIAALVSVTLWALVRRSLLGFLGAWFFILLLPTSSIVPVSEQPMAESRVYLPLAAVVTGLAVGLSTCLKQRSYLTVVGVLAVTAALLTAHRNRTYRDEITLWADTVRRNPDNARAICRLGDAVLAAGRTAEATTYYERAVQLKPDYVDGYNNLGSALLDLHRPQAAIVPLHKAVKLAPTNAQAHYNLGTAYLRIGDNAAAIGSFEAALRLSPHHAEAHNNLGIALLASRRLTEAITQFQSALSLSANLPSAQINLGTALLESGRTDEAVVAYKNAARLYPSDPNVHNNLGVILLRAGRFAEAREHFTTALRLRPDYPDARNNLALLPPSGPP